LQIGFLSSSTFVHPTTATGKRSVGRSELYLLMYDVPNVRAVVLMNEEDVDACEGTVLLLLLLLLPPLFYDTVAPWLPQEERPPLGDVMWSRNTFPPLGWLLAVQSVLYLLVRTYLHTYLPTYSSEQSGPRAPTFRYMNESWEHALGEGSFPYPRCLIHTWGNDTLEPVCVRQGFMAGLDWQLICSTTFLDLLVLVIAMCPPTTSYPIPGLCKSVRST
jgi:hypothetical protein